MNIRFGKWILAVVALLLVVGAGVKYHLNSVDVLETQVEEVSKNLEDTKVSYTAQIKAKTEELEELEKRHLQSMKELEELSVELEEKDNAIKNKDQQVEEKVKEIAEQQRQIEKLKKDLQAKNAEKTRVAKANSEQTHAVNVSNKSQVLSKKEEAKSEQSQPKAKNDSGGGHSLGTFTVSSYAVGDGMTPSVTTANGTNVANTIYSPEGYRIIAVDTRVIPMNTIVEITVNGQTFLAKASDTGSAIKGNKIDLLVSSPSKARSNGLMRAVLKIVK